MNETNIIMCFSSTLQYLIIKVSKVILLCLSFYFKYDTKQIINKL